MGHEFYASGPKSMSSVCVAEHFFWRTSSAWFVRLDAWLAYPCHEIHTAAGAKEIPAELLRLAALS